MVNDSNRSVHLFQKVLTSTWILTVGSDEQMAACFLLTDFNLVTSYRSKLEGIFRALKIIEHSKIKICILNFLHWCDNEQSVIDSQYASSCPTDMNRADKDLVLSTHHLK